MPLLRNLLAGDSLAARAVRFAMVGGTSGAAYALFTWVLVRKAALSPALASACAYALVIPINFALQKLFTFRSANPLREETPRYLAVHGANILCAYLPTEDAAHTDYELEAMGERHPIVRHTRPPYDPDRRQITA